MASSNTEHKSDAEQRMERRYQIRQVTHYQPSWREKERGEEGSFYIQLILDHGVDEYVIEPEVRDAEVLLQLLSAGGYIGFDMERKVLMFPNSTAK